MMFKHNEVNFEVFLVITCDVKMDLIMSSFPPRSAPNSSAWKHILSFLTETKNLLVLSTAMRTSLLGWIKRNDHDHLPRQ